MPRRTTTILGAALAVALGLGLTTSAQGAPLTETQKVTLNNDWNKDGLPDLAALTQDGKIYIYKGNRLGFTNSAQLVVSGLKGYDSARLAGDVDEDGHVDILARTTAGQMWVLRGGPDGKYAGSTRVDGDWSSFDEVLPIDLNRDGKVDLVAFDQDYSPGVQLGNFVQMYAGEAGTTFRKQGSKPLGTQQFDDLVAWGDRDKDGYQEVVTFERSTGRLLALETNGAYSPFQTNSEHRVIGTGWGNFNAILSNGDVDGDGNPDMLARTYAGELLLYRSDDQGHLSRGVVIGTGWQNLTLR